MEMLANTVGGRDLACFLKATLPDFLFLPRVAELAVELQLDALGSLTMSELYREWVNAIELRERFANSYKIVSEETGELRCGNVSFI